MASITGTGLGDKVLLEFIKKTIPYTASAFQGAKEKYDHFCSNKFLPYLSHEYKRLNISTSILNRNEGFKIDQLYVPLTICNSQDVGYVCDSFPEEIFDENNKIIICDSAGMGKSTLLKMLFRYAINDSYHLPFYIDLKSLIDGDKVLNVEEYIENTLPSFTKNPSLDFIKTLFDENQYLFLFDGADEVPDSYKKKVFAKIDEFSSKANKSKFIIATREEDIILSSFYDCIKFGIKPLTESEAYTLIRKYEFDDVSSEEVIEAVQQQKNESIKEFLENPLLTSLLYKAYTHSKSIPIKKSKFYKQVYSALFENHDSTKPKHLVREKKSGLDIDQFEKVLSMLAFSGRVEEQLEYEESELRNLLNDIIKSEPLLDFKARDFMKDVISAVPIFKKDGLKYAWQHKSIQEYFFVVFIINHLEPEDKVDVLNKLMESRNFTQFKLTLDILYDEEENLFHNILTRNILNKLQDVEPNNKAKILDSFVQYAINDKEIISHEKLRRVLSNDDFRDQQREVFLENIEVKSKERFDLSLSLTVSEEARAVFFYCNEYLILDVLREKHSVLVSSLIRKNRSSINKGHFAVIKSFKDLTLTNINQPSDKKHVEKIIKLGKVIMPNINEIRELFLKLDNSKQEKSKFLNKVSFR
ncbi:NACHT domain-containing NTPase [Vibrio sp. 10N.261.49.A5]|uniref:NACHT domain-containing protein n=2 Tax=Vibrio TaxID=662 RepID=A0ABX3B8U9_9VIBR|nr:NACHT domain-containing protein [Vibrio tasmaniensis]OEF52658.1 hypothetical protein A163_03995 [Vibrio tasmaniensis 1F-267]